MSSNCIDYFALVGRHEGALVCKDIQIGWEDAKSDFRPSDLWVSAIVDISVVFVDKGEVLPDESWEIVQDTIDGNPANLNSGDLARGLAHIAIKRRANSKRTDHIVEVSLVKRGEEIPEGFEIVQTSVSGNFPGDINTATSSSFLAYKRANNGLREYFVGTPFVDDICVVIESQGEDAPEGYVVLDNYANSGPPYGDTVRIAYRNCVPLGLCDLRYESATLERYPAVDLPEHELPSKELPLFVFPHQLELQTASLDQYPLPDFFSMVFTDAKGDYLYCACLRFFELLENDIIVDFCKNVYGVDLGCEASELDIGFSIYCPKVICVVSTNPFYRAMRRYLRQLYSMSLSSPQCPLEFFITSVVGLIPVPIEGGRPFVLHLDAALINPTARAMPPILFEVPPSRFFPHMDLDFSAPLRCLSVDKFLALFCLMLQEAKILFVCNSNALLTEVMETLRSLLYPLTWSSCFVSRLPNDLSGLLQALGGFMIGLHLPLNAGGITGAFSAQISSVEKKQAIQTFFSTSTITASLYPGTYTVDLSDNEIYQYTGDSELSLLAASKINMLVKSLPAGPKKRLSNKLQAISTEFLIGPQTSGLEIFDSAFEFQLADGAISSKQWDKFPTLEVRDAFMVFMIDLLGDYSKYVIPPKQDLSQDVYRTFKEQFNTTEYLADCEKSLRPLLTSLMETQMFAVLLQQRSESQQFSLVFFESAAEMLREMGLKAGGHGRPQGSWTMSKGVDLPVPLYKLLDQRRYASLVEHKNQDDAGTGRTSSYRSAGPLERAVARLEALESVKRSCSDGSTDGGLDEGSGDEDCGNGGDRTELERFSTAELSLEDPEFGPLVVPGPCLTDIDVESELLNMPYAKRQHQEINFSYANGWPSLDLRALELAKRAVHPKVQNIREQRVYAHEKIDRHVRMMMRSPSERVSFRLSGRLLREVNCTTEKENRASMGLHVDIASTSILMLSVRVIKKCRPVNDILQIFGIIADYDCMGMLSLVDESIWRAVLVACTKCGGDFMRGASCVIFETMKDINIVPDAVTYGQYIRAISAVKSTVSCSDGSNVLDAFVHLEELGLMWLVHRFYELTRSQRLRKDTSSFGSPSGSGSGRKSLGFSDFFKSRSPSTDSQSREELDIPNFVQQLFSQIYSKLELTKVSGTCTLSAPAGFLLPVIPRYVNESSTKVPSLSLESQNLIEHFDNIGMEIFNRYASEDHVRLQKEFSPFRCKGRVISEGSDPLDDIYIPPTSPSSSTPTRTGYISQTTSPVTSPNSAKQPSRWFTFSRKQVSEEKVETVRTITSALEIGRESIEGEDVLDIVDLLNKESEKSTSADDAMSSAEADDKEHSDASELLSPGAKFAKDSLVKVETMFSEFMKTENTIIGIHSHTPCRCGFALLDEEILSMWCGFSGGCKVSNPNLALEGESALNIATAHQVNCPQCRGIVTPMLHVRCYGLSGSTREKDKDVEVLWENDVPYCSPFGLRFGIEEILQQIGEQSTDSSWLLSRRPELFWNIMWYFTRGGFPSGLLPIPLVTRRDNGNGSSKGSHLDGLILTGWREHVVKLRAQQYLRSNKAISTDVRIEDLFYQGCLTKTDIERVETMLEQIESPDKLTIESVKNIVIEISQMPKLLDSCCGGNVIGRNIYLVFLAVLQIYRPGVVAGDNLFDKLYAEVVDTLLNEQELEALGTTRQLMKVCLSNKAALTIRSSFGAML